MTAGVLELVALKPSENAVGLPFVWGMKGM